MEINTKALIKYNIDALAALLVRESILKAHAHYHGCSDEGGEFEISFYDVNDETMDEPDELIDFKVVQRTFVDGEWKDSVEVVEHDPVDAVEHICESLIEHSGNGGYDNGEGGTGGLTIHADGTFEYEHSDYVTVTEVRTTLSLDDLVTDQPKALPATPAT